jgi:hypothetical protein
MEDYRKLALEAAMKIPYQTHSELLTSADRIYHWLMKTRITINTDETVRLLSPLAHMNKKSPPDTDEDLIAIETRRLGSNSRL